MLKNLNPEMFYCTENAKYSWFIAISYWISPLNYLPNPKKVESALRRKILNFYINIYIFLLHNIWYINENLEDKWRNQKCKRKIDNGNRHTDDPNGRVSR